MTFVLPRYRTILASAYKPTGMTFDATAYGTKASALSGVSDGKSGLCSFWMLNPNAGGTQRTIFTLDIAGATNRVAIAVSGSTGKVFWNGRDSGNTIRLSFQTSNAYTSMTTWKHFLFSFNTATPMGQIYVNNASDITAGATLDSTNNIVFSAALPTFGAVSNGATPVISQIADFQLWFNVDLDISIEGNRTLFIDGYGNAVNPRVAARSLGTQSILLSGNNSSGWLTNLGLAGGFAQQTGSISTSSTNPP